MRHSSWYEYVGLLQAQAEKKKIQVNFKWVMLHVDFALFDSQGLAKHSRQQQPNLYSFAHQF